MKNTIQNYLDSASEKSKEALQKQIAEFAPPSNAIFEYPFAPLESIPSSTEEERIAGENGLRNEPLALLLLAGGVGSRLNFQKAKGLFPISPLRKKTLFQLFFEHCKALEQTYATHIEIGILFDRHNQPECIDYLRENSFFGIHENQIHPLVQKETPYTYEGNWFLENEHRIAAAPNGNGGLFDAEGIDQFLEMMAQKKIENCFLLPIDNPFLFHLSPSHLGRHILSKADITCSGIERETNGNPMGLFAKGDQGAVIIDYPLIEECGNSDTFHYGNINAFCLSTSFLQKGKHTPLPLHRVLKKTLRFDPISNESAHVEAIKTEKFITDLTLIARHSAIVLRNRELDYAPLKTEADVSGIQQKMVFYDQNFLKKNNGSFAGEIELHPRYFYMDPNRVQELLQKKGEITGYLD